MKKFLTSSLLVFALSGIVMAQAKQPSKNMHNVTTKTTTQPPTDKTVQKKNTTTKNTTVMTKPKHRKIHKTKTMNKK